MGALKGLLGLALLILIAVAVSRHRRGISVRTVLAALGLQVVFAILVLRWPPGEKALAWAADREYKLDGAVAVLDDGRVVMPSGPGLGVFDPSTGQLVPLPVASYDTRSFRTLTSLGNNQVLVAGGYDDGIIPTDQAVLVTVPDRPGT